jgi:type II secretory pathway pseudopilin PulG
VKTVKTKMTDNRRDRGFSLVELLVAAGVFVVICGAALSLFAKHQPLFNQQQNLAALNIQIRNAVSQLQLDTINAGSGFYQGTNIPSAPIGITIKNNTTTPCNTPSTFTYGANCFDQLNIITVDPSTPSSHPSTIASGCIDTSASATIYANPVAPTTAAQLAADFHNGDQLLLLKADGSKMTAVELTQAGLVSGSQVRLTITTTAALTGVNILDPAYIAANAASDIQPGFCIADWILKILPITYKVDTSVASDPKLIREQPSGSANDVVVAEQLVAFKVGAITWNSCNVSCTSDDGSTYNYDSSTYSTQAAGNQPYNFPLIRSVQVELIGRTNPNPDPSYVYRNGFDGGPYQIESVSIVVNPRNLTMN